jgi:hypothetical protein
MDGSIREFIAKRDEIRNYTFRVNLLLEEKLDFEQYAAKMKEQMRRQFGNCPYLQANYI